MELLPPAASLSASPSLALKRPCSNPCSRSSSRGVALGFAIPASSVGRSNTETGEGWEACKNACRSRARVTCVGGNDKLDAARKAVETALGEKKDAFSKWDEEIKKREAGGGSGGARGRGRGWGGGGGGDSGEAGSESNSWEEAKQIFFAFTGLAALYLVLTKGKSMLAFTLNSVLFVLRGFKRPSSYTAPIGEQSLGPVGADGLGHAESNVINKWGRD